MCLSLSVCQSGKSWDFFLGSVRLKVINPLVPLGGGQDYRALSSPVKCLFWHVCFLDDFFSILRETSGVRGRLTSCRCRWVDAGIWSELVCCFSDLILSGAAAAVLIADRRCFSPCRDAIFCSAAAFVRQRSFSCVFLIPVAIICLSQK